MPLKGGSTELPRTCKRWWRRAATAAAAAAVLLSLTAPPATADDPVAQARERLQQAQSDANAAGARYFDAVAERDRAQSQITSLEQAIPALRAREAELKAQLSDRAAALYRNADPAEGLEILGSRDVVKAARRSALTEAAADYDEQRVRELHQTADRLEQAESQLRQKKAELDVLLPKLDQERVLFEQKVAEANRRLELAEQLGALRATGQEPVMGPPVMSADELVAWYRSTGARPRLSGGETFEGLARIYVEEGMAENVRGDVAFAQSYIETGGFTHGGSDNNFSGLGACDTCTSETRFPTARDGVRAQIQHLRNYADRRSRAANLHNPPSPYWYGTDPATAAANFDTFFAKGWAPTWQLMGNGNWATDPSYAGKVIGVYNRMIAFVNRG